MMSLRRIVGLMLLFLFFEAIVVVATKFLLPGANLVLACIAMTGLAIATWIVFFILARLIASRTQKPAAQPKVFVPAPSKVPADSFSQEFSALLAEADRRLTALLGSGTKRNRSTVTSLPLYLILGGEGAGKTSILVNSGLDPRLLAGEAQKDGTIVPTATANLWYAEGAVLIEMSGRLLMQDSGHWEKALQILGQQRQISRWQRLFKGAPNQTCDLRGVIVVFETQKFLETPDPRRLGAVSRTLNDRLQAIQSILRIDFPAYVLFTRCESVPHFQEFFSHLSDSETRRILGITLPPEETSREYGTAYAERENNRFSKLFNRLYQAIADKRMLLLAREGSAERRAHAYEFPRELKKIRGEMVQFLIETFRPSALYPPCRLRGFYFCGRRVVPRAHSNPDETVTGTETGVFRKISDATVIFSMERSSTLEFSIFPKTVSDSLLGKWAFLTEVFQEIILKDPAGKVRLQPAGLAESKYVSAAFAVAGVFFLLLSVILVFSWQNNYHLLREVEAAVSGTRVIAAQTPLENLPDLEVLRPQLVRLHSFNRGSSSLSYHWGLYSGYRAAKDLDRLYYTRFRQAILDPALNAMTTKFLQLQPDSPATGDVYKELKTYRTLTSGICSTDDTLVASTMLPMWVEALSPNPQSQALADNQIQFYARELKIADPFGKRIPENSLAVLKAQRYLRDLTGPDKILQAVLNQVRQVSPESLSAYASNYIQVLSGPDQIEGPYTREGWTSVEESIRNHKLVTSGERCVLGDGSGISSWGSDLNLDSQIQSLYSGNYIESWEQFLRGHHVLPFSGATDAAQKLRILANNNHSPLLALIYMISTNTNVAVPTSLRDRAEEGVYTASHTVKDVMSKLSGGKSSRQPGTPDRPTDRTRSVAQAFDALHVVVDPGSPDKWLNDKNQPYMKALGDLSDALQTLPPQVHTDVPLEGQELQQATSAVAAAETALRTLQGTFSRTSSGIDVDLGVLLEEPIIQARRIVASVVMVTPPKPPPPITPSVPDKTPAAEIPKPVVVDLRPTIGKVNASAVALCSVAAPLRLKFPFDPASTTDASVDELNQLLRPGTGEYSRFSNLPEVSGTYNHQGRIWAPKPEFHAIFSQAFLSTLNAYGEAEDELYGAGTDPHIDITISLDGTGKVPYELNVDGHNIKYAPGHQTPPLHLVWPPLTDAPARLVVKNGGKNNQMQDEWSGPWALFHLLQTADVQSGDTFTFTTFRFGHSLNPLKNEKGGPATIQIRVASAAGNLFSRGYFSKLRCNDTWALQPQSPGN